MNDTHNGQKSIHLAAGTVLKDHHLRACVDGRPRTSREIADQLTRDAQSLELTGASFEKDEAFYRTVAANVREAAALLGQWPTMIESMNRAADGRERAARFDGFIKSQEIATGVAELVHRSAGGAATTWRIAALAVNEAIQAVRDSLPRQETATNLAALERELLEGTVEKRT